MPIQFNNVSLKIGQKSILEDLSFKVKKSEITAIIGPSGSGKSSLLKLILGINKPNAGSILVNEKRVDYGNIYQLRRGFGYAQQGASLFPHLTIKENITLVAKQTGMSTSDISKKLNMIIQNVQLSNELLKNYPHQLSGGEIQRAGIARALFLNAEILLLDEPFAALDISTKSEIHNFFLELQSREAKTILFVTHDPAETRFLADSCIIINNGRIEQSDSLDNILLKPKSKFVESFFNI